MNDREIQRKDDVEIDMGRILEMLIRKAWLAAAAAAIGAVAAFLITLLLIAPQYQSTAMFYVNNNAVSEGAGSPGSISSADIAASKNLVDSYIVILQSRETLEAVIADAGTARTYEEVKKMISASAVNSTEFFEVVVTGPNPREAERIANAIVHVLPQRISLIIEGASAKIVDAAIAASKPSAPCYLKNVGIGFLLGLFLSAGVIALRTALDTTIRTRADVLQNCEYPVLAEIPCGDIPGKDEKRPMLIGSGMGAACAEAYKLLRTKVQFSFADDSTSHVIGVSSALGGEGKSVTAVNLACCLTRLGKKTLLVDCNMRRSAFAPKGSKKPGLADFLSGQCSAEDVIQYCGVKREAVRFPVIMAGQEPPNPNELINSEKMTALLARAREIYDYVILDLPPVGEVSDALAVVKETDGVVLVVRQDRCKKAALRDMMQQLEFVNARILGVVYNCAAER